MELDGFVAQLGADDAARRRAAARALVAHGEAARAVVPRVVDGRTPAS